MVRFQTLLSKCNLQRHYIQDKNGKVNLGSSLGAGLYQLVVEPGEPRSQFSTSDLEDPTVAARATIGIVNNFTIFSRDRFGNKVGRCRLTLL